MITQDESGLTEAEYEAIQQATKDLAVQAALQRLGPVWSLRDSTGQEAGGNFDAAIAGDYLVRVFGLADLVIERLAGGDDAWETVANAVEDYDSMVPPSIAVDGSMVRIFYLSTANKIRYTECADIATGTFDAGNDVTGELSATLKFLAAVSTERVHYILMTDQNNRRFYVVEWNGLAWAPTVSDTLWPFPIYAFDAVSLGDTDILVSAAEIPPLLGSRAVGTEVSREIDKVQAIVLHRVHNGLYSDYFPLDVMDRVGEGQYTRNHVRISSANGSLFVTYTRLMGTETNSVTRLAISRSKDGYGWEFPELVNVSGPALVLPRSDYLYLVGTNETYRSPCCTWAGQTPVEQSLSSYILAIQSRAADIRQSTLKLANVRTATGNALDGTLIDQSGRMRIVQRLGYYSGPSPLTVQTAIEDIISIRESRGLPARYLELVSQDALGRLGRITSDYAAEWPGLQSGRDNYDDPTGTGYGAMRFTAPYEGSWKGLPDSNILELKSSLVHGVAVSTFVTDALNGSAEVGFVLNNTDKNEYAGISFRTFDKDNLFYVAYFADTNVVKVVARKGADSDDEATKFIDTVLATSDPIQTGGGVDWNADLANFHYLKVWVRGGLLQVYKSDDGVTWDVIPFGGESTVELPGLADGSLNYNVWSGKFGLVGYGWSESDEPPDWEPDPWIPPSPNPSANGVVVLCQNILARSTDCFDVEEPSWTDIRGNIMDIGPVIDWVQDEDGSYQPVYGDTVILYNVALQPGGTIAYVTANNGLWRTSNYLADDVQWVRVAADTDIFVDKDGDGKDDRWLEELEEDEEAPYSYYHGRFGAVAVLENGTVIAPIHCTQADGSDSNSPAPGEYDVPQRVFFKDSIRADAWDSYDNRGTSSEDYYVGSLRQARITSSAMNFCIEVTSSGVGWRIGVDKGHSWVYRGASSIPTTLTFMEFYDSDGAWYKSGIYATAWYYALYAETTAQDNNGQTIQGPVVKVNNWFDTPESNQDSPIFVTDVVRYFGMIYDGSVRGSENLLFQRIDEDNYGSLSLYIHFTKDPVWVKSTKLGNSYQLFPQADPNKQDVTSGLIGGRMELVGKYGYVWVASAKARAGGGSGYLSGFIIYYDPDNNSWRNITGSFFSDMPEDNNVWEGQSTSGSLPQCNAVVRVF